ncbi:VW5B2 protein, partial [Atractosteus spatula]|nr:VW5B2 protein [Atractosteus spatula]
MPGLLNRSTWAPLLLKASCIKSCANGCSLGITAHLTYLNPHSEPVEGVFVYPLQETEVVVGFEAVIAGRMVSVQIQSRAKAEDCCLDCCASSAVEPQCSNGHLVLDEDLERTTFIVGTGVIAPMNVVTVIISTTLELSTLHNGAIHLVFPSVFTPIVTRMAQTKNETGGRCDENGPTTCFGATSGKQEKTPDSDPQCIHAIFTCQASTTLPYELNFELLVRGACLLAGLESPTHALRADADPSAQSASATYITLAEEHPYDRHLEIILHLSEPHTPHILLEKGRLTFEEYEHQICSRRDFIRCARKEADPEKKLEFVRKRFHKDIFSNPVLMLNFCPDLLSVPYDLHRATREVLFLIDRSGSMIFLLRFLNTVSSSLQEAMIVAIKSLPPGTLLNIVGFGSTIQTLFSTSKICNDDTLSQACEYVQKMRASMGGTNIFGALSWVFRQPVHKGYPRQLFILTDGSVSSVGKVIELVRRHASTARCFGLGLGPLACRRLLHGIAKATGGSTEFLSEEERLQPKLMNSLKKAFEPAITDIRIDWYVPDNMEALLSPNEIAPLYPGDCLIGYCTLYDVSSFRSRKAGVSLEGLSILKHNIRRPSPGPSERCDIEEALREISREISSEFSCARPTDTGTGGEMESSSDVRKRILQASYIQEQYVLTRCSVSSERGLPHGSSSSESPGARDLVLETGSLPQGLEKVSQPERKSLSRWESPWKQAPAPPRNESSNGKAGAVPNSEESRWRQRTLARSAMSGRSFSSPQGELDMHRLRRALEKVSFDQTLGGRLEESDGETQPTPRGALSRRSLTDSNSLLFPASPLDWDSFTDPEYLFTAAPAEETPPPLTQCRSIIQGLLAGKPVSWEVKVNLELLLVPQGPGSRTDGWEEMMHQLTARSVIRDFENMAERESDIEHGPAKRYRTKAIQTSKGCNTISMYTAFTVVDASTNEGLVGSLEVRNAEEFEDTFLSTDRDDTPASPRSMTSCDSRSSWYPASPSAMSVRSQRSVESKSVDSFFGSRFSLGRLRSSNSSAKQVPLKPHCLSAETERSSETETIDYLPLVRLQLASGAFLLTDLYSEYVQIPLERLKRASPFSSHRSSLSPPSRCTSPRTPAKPAVPHAPEAQPGPSRERFSEGDPMNALLDCLSSDGVCSDPGGGFQQADSGRGSETDMFEGSPLLSESGGASLEPSGEQLAQQDLQSSSWATAVALAWLEHQCAGFFVEWELIAAKADSWLRAQQLPEGIDLAGLKGAARQLFLLLRHWDENIKLNMLCYNPNNV